MLRPTSFRIGVDEAADMTVTGTVDDVVFRGATRTMKLRSGDLVLSLEVPAASAPRSGESVTAYVLAGEAWALPQG